MMNKIKNIFLGLLLFMIQTSCKEEFPGPLSTKGEMPPAVTNVQVRNIPGGAVLKYVLPEDDDILYVNAVYEYPKGVEKEVKSSAYVDTLVIEGIGDTNELDVKLYSVNRAEKVSEPVMTKIKPLTPAVLIVGETMRLEKTFGGVTVFFENSTKSNLVFTILKKEDDEWKAIETLYTKLESGNFSARGQDSILAEYGVFVRDRWHNKSDTLIKPLKPIFEQNITTMVPVTTLASDYNKHYQTFYYTRLFNGIISNADYAGTLLDSPASKLPQSFTIDFKVPTEFSRFKLWFRVGHFYNNGQPEVWEIWGANELNDDWSKWTFIQEYRAIKPSGLPLGQLSDEDRAAAEAGLDFDFPPGTKHRYLRWKTTKNFASVDYVQFSELSFWGVQE